MDRKHFLKSVLLTTGGVLLGGTTIYRYLNSKETTDASLPSLIDKIHQGNMKKILVIMSAGTKRGNTDRLTDAYIKGLVERGHSVTKVYLGNMRIEGCRGCGVCQRLAHQCAVRDGMEDIYPLFAECDTVVMASPLYFWTITSQLKAFIDRLYAISADDKSPQKHTVLLMTAGDEHENTFDQPKQYFRLLSQALGWNEVGISCAGGCTGREKLARQIDKVHLENVYTMGLEL